jgi:hypothetical protein
MIENYLNQIAKYLPAMVFHAMKYHNMDHKTMVNEIYTLYK